MNRKIGLIICGLGAVCNWSGVAAESKDSAVVFQDAAPAASWYSIGVGSSEEDDFMAEAAHWKTPERVDTVLLRLGLPFNDARNAVTGLDMALVSTGAVQIDGLQYGFLTWSDAVDGWQGSLFYGLVNRKLQGLQSSLVLCQATQFDGIQFSLVNVAYPGVEPLPPKTSEAVLASFESSGLQCGVIGNLADRFEGIQGGVFSNHAEEITGLQAALYNRAAGCDGIQLSGIGRSDNLNGYQLSLLVSQADSVGGVQAALINQTARLEGFQCGVTNVAEFGGVQIGLFNLAEAGGLQIGLFNYLADGFLPFFPLGNF